MSSPAPIQSPVEALETARRESQQATYKQLHATLRELNRLDVPVLDHSHLQGLGMGSIPSLASCSPSSRRISPAASIQLPAPRGPSRPCCAGCTYDCRCGKAPASTHGAFRTPSESSETQRGRQEGSRGESRPREASSKRTASCPSQDPGREAPSTMDPRIDTKRLHEGRAVSVRAQSVSRPVQAQAQIHDDLPLRGSGSAVDHQASSSEIQARTGQSEPRGRDASAVGPHGQPPAPAVTLPWPPPLPQAAGASGPGQGQYQQQQSQQTPRGQKSVQAMPYYRDPRHASIGSRTHNQGAATTTQTQPQMLRLPVRVQSPSALQQPPHGPFHGPGTSYQVQAGPPPLSTPAGPAVAPHVGVPPHPQRQPDETPFKKKENKKSTQLKNVISFGKRKDKDGHK